MIASTGCTRIRCCWTRRSGRGSLFSKANPLGLVFFWLQNVGFWRVHAGSIVPPRRCQRSARMIVRSANEILTAGGQGRGDWGNQVGKCRSTACTQSSPGARRADCRQATRSISARRTGNTKEPGATPIAPSSLEKEEKTHFLYTASQAKTLVVHPISPRYLPYVYPTITRRSSGAYSTIRISSAASSTISGAPR